MMKAYAPMTGLSIEREATKLRVNDDHDVQLR